MVMKTRFPSRSRQGGGPLPLRARLEPATERMPSQNTFGHFGAVGLSEIRMLSVLFDRVAIRKYSPPVISFSRSGSESFSVPAILLKP